MAVPNPIRSDELQQYAWRFWKYVNRNGPVPQHCPELGPCWLWTGEVSGKPGRHYGRFRIGNRSVGTHRVAYALAHGVLLNFACHRCDVRLCCRPDHIFDGSAADNTADMMRKGRHVPRHCRPPSEYKHPSPRAGHYRSGTGVHFAKMTADSVRELRAAHANGTDCVALGKRYGISATAARNIVIRKAWRSVP